MNSALPPTSLANPVLWVFGSLAVAIVASNLGWLLVRLWGKREMPGGAVGSSFLAALTWLLTSLFLFWPPLAAWRSGAISPYQLGLSELSWVADLGTAGPLLAATVGLTIFGWLVYRRSLRADRLLWKPGAFGPAWRAPLDAALQQWHWAFYRAGVIGWLVASRPDIEGAISLWTAHASTAAEIVSPFARALTGQPLYWGSWLGLVLAAAEWLLNPFARADLRQPGRRERALLRASLAVTTTAMFTLARNFWLCLACQVIAETVIVAWLRPPAETMKDD